MWKYYAFRFTGLTIAYLPRKLGYLTARFTAFMVYMLSPVTREAVADNMRRVLGPEADEAALKRAVRDVLRNAAKNYYDLIRLPHMRLKDIKDRIKVNGWHNLEDAINRGKGVILVTAHIGSFDMAAQVFPAHSTKVTGLVEPLEPEVLLNHVVALRNCKGMNFMPVQLGVLKVVMQSLHRGEVVLIVCDRDFGKDGLRLSFFGEETSMPVGAVRIAMRTGAAVVPVFNLRQKNGCYDVYFEPAVDIIPEGDGAVAKNMEQIISVMERYIKTYPEQWVVLSPVWESGERTSLSG